MTTYIRVHVDTEDLPGRTHARRVRDYCAEVSDAFLREYPAANVTVRPAIACGDWIDTDADDVDALYDLLRDVRAEFWIDPEGDD